jgi:hypothetical protein
MTVHWVCPECGLDYDTISPRDAVLAARTFPRRYRSLLTHLDPDEDPDSVIRRRPAPDVWSALEYTAHVADILDWLASSIRRIEVEDQPRLYEFDPDEKAEEEEYNDLPLVEALGRLETACADLSNTIEFMDPAAWTRTGRYEWGEREAIDLARNAVHEGSHHLRDIQRVLTQVRGRTTEERW